MKRITIFILSVLIVLSSFITASALDNDTPVNSIDFKYGDINSDGKILIEDVILIQKYIAKLIEFSTNQMIAADVNDDGEFSIEDVLLVQKYVARIIDKFPVDENHNTEKKQISDKEYNDFKNVQQATINIEKKHLNNKGYIEESNVASLLNEIEEYAIKQKKSGAIVDFNKNASSFLIRFKSGIKYIFTPELENRLVSGSSKQIVTYEPVKNSFSYKFEKAFAEAYEYAKAYELLLFDDNYNLIPQDLNVTANAELLSSSDSFSYSEIENSFVDTEVTIDSLKNLSENSVIIWEGHGTFDKSLGSILFTGQKANSKEDLNSSYLSDDSFVISKNNYLGVTYHFFENFNNNALRNSIIYLGACESAKDNRLHRLTRAYRGKQEKMSYQPYTKHRLTGQ